MDDLEDDDSEVFVTVGGEQIALDEVTADIRVCCELMECSLPLETEMLL